MLNYKLLKIMDIEEYKMSATTRVVTTNVHAAHAIQNATQTGTPSAQIASPPIPTSPYEQLAKLLIQIKKNAEWKADHYQNLQVKERLGVSGASTSAKLKEYQENQYRLYESAFNIWASNKFPQWETLGQKLFTQFFMEDTANNIVINFAIILAEHHIQQAIKLKTFSEKTKAAYHIKDCKEQFIKAIDFLQEAYKKLNETTPQALKAKLDALLAYSFYYLSKETFSNADREFMQKVLGVEKEISVFQEHARYLVSEGDLEEGKIESYVESKILERIVEIISENVGRFSRLVNAGSFSRLAKDYEKSIDPKSRPCLVPSDFSFEMLEKNEGNLSDFARRLGVQDATTLKTPLHSLAEAACAEKEYNLIRKLLLAESEFLAENKEKHSALIIKDRNGLLPSDVATDSELQKLLGSFPVEGEFIGRAYSYETAAGYGIVPLGTKYSIDAERLALQITSILLSSKLEGTEQTLGHEFTAVTFKSVGLEKDYDPKIKKPAEKTIEKESDPKTAAETQKSTAQKTTANTVTTATAVAITERETEKEPEEYIEKILILDDFAEGIAALVFSISEKHRNNPKVNKAIFGALNALDLTSNPDANIRALLKAAIHANDEEAVAALLQNKQCREIINQLDASGHSLLSMTVSSYECKKAIAIRLIEAGADPTLEHRSQDNLNCFTPFWRAAYYGHAAVVDCMLKKIKAENKWSENNAQKLKELVAAALFRAVFCGNVAMVRVLLAHDANPNTELTNLICSTISSPNIQSSHENYSNVGDTAFLWAVGLLSGIQYTQPYYFVDMVEAFLNNSKYPVDIKRETKTRMHHALLPDVATVETPIKDAHGNQLKDDYGNIRKHKYRGPYGIQVGYNALMVALGACAYSDNKVYHDKIKLLLIQGANPKEIAFNNKTAYTIASERLMQDVIFLFDNFKKYATSDSIKFKQIPEHASLVKGYLKELLEIDKRFTRKTKAKRGIEAYGLIGKQYLDFKSFSEEVKALINLNPSGNVASSPSSLMQFMEIVERQCKAILGNEKYTRTLLAELNIPEAHTVAKALIDILDSQSRLNGWLRFALFVENPSEFLERTKCVTTPPLSDGRAKKSTRSTADIIEPARFNTVARWDAGANTLEIPPGATSKVMEALMSTPFMQEACYLWSYVLNLCLQTSQNPRFAELFTECGALCSILLLTSRFKTHRARKSDLSISERVNQWINLVGERVNLLMNQNPQRFNQYRELQKKGVQWRHSPEVRKDIEKTGFTFNPLMIKRARCICFTCGVEVSDWQVYSIPKNLHDVTLHPSSQKLMKAPLLFDGPLGQKAATVATEAMAITASAAATTAVVTAAAATTAVAATIVTSAVAATTAAATIAPPEAHTHTTEKPSDPATDKLKDTARKSGDATDKHVEKTLMKRKTDEEAEILAKKLTTAEHRLKSGMATLAGLNPNETIGTLDALTRNLLQILEVNAPTPNNGASGTGDTPKVNGANNAKASLK